MTYTLSIATEETRDLVVDALRAAADQRTRVARGAARQVAAAKAGGTDVRSRSVKVTALLAEAGDLAELAEELAAATEVAVITVAADGALEFPPAKSTPLDALEAMAAAAVATVGTDDGTSLAAQAIADLAGLTPHDPDAPEDPLTGATPEDEPTAVEEVLT